MMGDELANATLRILVADDDIDILNGTARIMMRAGYEVDKASNGVEALDIIYQRKPDILLTDRDMPEMDGIELCLSIKRTPELSDIIVVIVSGTFTDSDEQAEGLEAQADGYIVRPVANRELLARVAAFARIQRLNKSLQDQTAKLRESEDRLREVLESSVDAVYKRNLVTDKCDYISPVITQITGYSVEYISEQPFSWIIDLVPVDDRSEPQRIFQQAMADHSRTAYNMDYRIQHQNGDDIWLHDRFVVMRDDQGNPVSLIGSVSDITCYKQIEADKARLLEQLQKASKLESIGRLAGGIAHDFNNMLGVILGHTHLALADIDSSHPLHADLVEIGQAAERSAVLTRQLLAFARKQSIMPKIVDLNESLEAVLGTLQGLVGENIRIIWNPATELCQVNMDPSQLDFIMANLCMNARDAISNEGMITIAASNVSLDQQDCAHRPGLNPGDYVKLVVSDNGRGMDKRTLDNIFEPFFTTKRFGEGGMGLASVYGGVKQNGGFIEAQSQIGVGTSIVIYLPTYAEPLQAINPEPNIGIDKCQNGIVMLVEDEPSILRMTTLMLKRLGYDVLPFNSPSAALRFPDEKLYEVDLLLTDVVMPGMSGRELADELQKRRPELRCMFMSGYPADVMTQDIKQRVGVYFVQKPFTMSVLSDMMRQALYRPSDEV